MQTTVCGKLFPTNKQACEIEELMRRQSSCMRYAYNRLCEGQSKNDIYQDTKEKFSDLNSRYRTDGYFRAKHNYDSAKKLVQAGKLESEDKIVFGKRENLKRRKQGEITNTEWRKIRNNQLYSRGDQSNNGNVNLRFVHIHDEIHLRINIGSYEWIHVSAYLPQYKEELLTGETAYNVRILREDGEYTLRVSFNKEYDEPEIGFDHGAIGVDFNQDTIDLAVTNKQGQLKDVETFDSRRLATAQKKEKERILGIIAKQIIQYATHWERGLVVEHLEDVTAGQRNQHQFIYRKFLTYLKRRAEKEGVRLKEVNPAYTSVIGRFKYMPFYNITIHQAAALVIARRGQDFSEYLRELKTDLLDAMEAREEWEDASNRRMHSWCLWRLTRNLPSHQGTNYTHPDQSSETIEVESSGTSSLTERRPEYDDSSGREIVIPNNGPAMPLRQGCEESLTKAQPL